MLLLSEQRVWQNYAFTPIDDKLFKGKAKVTYDANAKLRDKDFGQRIEQHNWQRVRLVWMPLFKRMASTKHFKWIMFASKALIENFIETGSETKPSKVDIGPVNTFLSKNFCGWYTS